MVGLCYLPFTGMSRISETYIYIGVDMIGYLDLSNVNWIPICIQYSIVNVCQ